MSIFNRQQILQMIPHSGSMCLLDEVLAWDEVSLRCLSRRYRDPDNPMRRENGVLGVICGTEIAGQTVAVHCRLLAESSGEPVQGYLVSLREVRTRIGRLDAIDGDLVIDADRLAGDAISATYQFVLSVAGTELLSGRLTVLLTAEQEGLGPK
jgi:predicted hotdog family 3-hydroxylacyl-ACP dehydratase